MLPESQLVRHFVSFIKNTNISTLLQNNHTGVYIYHDGDIIEPNSNILITDIGNSQPNRLVCITDRKPCCRGSNTTGDWIFPDGTKVPDLLTTEGVPAQFYVERGFSGDINLYRVSDDIITPTGRFCCRVPDAINVTHTVCVNVGERLKHSNNALLATLLNTWLLLYYKTICI